MKSFKLPALIGAAVLFVGVTVVQIGHYESRQLRKQVESLQREREELLAYARRLKAFHRVAQVTVQQQTFDEAGRPIFTLLWQETLPNELIGEPRALQVIGTVAYFEALVIKFQHDFVGEADPERGVSVALFRRVFGDRQSPDSAPPFDRRPLRRLDQQDDLDAQQVRLWAKFWDFVDDPRLASQYGVRIAQIEAPAVPLRVGQVWEITLDAAGGLNLKKASDASLTQS